MAVRQEDLERMRQARDAGPTTNGRAQPESKVRRSPQELPFAQVPLHWLPIVQHVRAERALPLLIAIAYQMRMDRKPRTGITSKTWARAGDARTESQRRAVIAMLRRVPSIVRLVYSQRTGSKYTAIKGRSWDHLPPARAVNGEGDKEEQP
jgi:hypothetical protein